MDISNRDDMIDSRDVIARIEELEDMRPDLDDPDEHNANCAAQGIAGNEFDPDLCDCRVPGHNDGLDDDDREELIALKALAAEGADYTPNWAHGEALIRDTYFKEYAQELADDIGAINSDANWPNNCIDWERAARELQMDYTSVDFDGVDYWVRS